jgi:branched-chain amino acid transport system permease protein
VTQTKVIAFAISSAFAGISGALLSSFMGYITTTQWTLAISIDVIAMVVIGGAGSIAGAVLGAFFVKGIPQLVTGLTGSIPFISQDAKVDGGITSPLLAQFLYGLAIVLVLLFEPRGLTAAFTKSYNAVRSRFGRGNK